MDKKPTLSKPRVNSKSNSQIKNKPKDKTNGLVLDKIKKESDALSEYTLKILEDQETSKIEKFIKEYVTRNLDPYEAYIATFPRALFKDECIARERASELIRRHEVIQIIEDKYSDLREAYKDQISSTFNLLFKIAQEDTYTHKDGVYDPRTKRIIEVEYEKSYSMRDRIKAAEVILKVFGYLDKQEVNIKIENNEYEFVKKVIDEESSNILTIQNNNKNDIIEAETE